MLSETPSVASIFFTYRKVFFTYSSFVSSDLLMHLNYLKLFPGLRFGIMQTKVALVTMLKNYEFLLNKDTKLPLRLNPATPFTAAADPILFDVKKVE